MRKTMLVLVVCAFSSITAANATTRMNAAAPNDLAAYATLQQTAGGKTVCVTKWVTQWVTKWVNTAKGRVQQRFQVRTPTAVCGVRG